mgnify:CR=1 FL=1
MRTLYHIWLNPFSRKVRIMLAEKKLDFAMEVEPVWERRTEFLALNPAGEVPVLVEPDNTVLSDSSAICEYLEEQSPEPNLMGGKPYEKAEVRRLVAWFDRKFHQEVTDMLVNEKVMKRFLGLAEEEIAENEHLWHEENGTPDTRGGKGSDMRGVGVSPGTLGKDIASAEDPTPEPGAEVQGEGPEDATEPGDTGEPADL